MGKRSAPAKKAEPKPKRERKSAAKSKANTDSADNFRNQPRDPQAAEFWNNFRQAQAEAPVPKDGSTTVDTVSTRVPAETSAADVGPQATQPDTEAVAATNGPGTDEVAAKQLEMAEVETHDKTKNDHAVDKVSTKNEHTLDLPASSSVKTADLDRDLQNSPQRIDYAKPPDDLKKWFSQDGVLALQTELERAKKHPLFATHSAEVLEEAGEDFVWGSEEGDPLADLELWLQYVVDKGHLEHELSAEDEQFWHRGLLTALTTASEEKKGQAGPDRVE